MIPEELLNKLPEDQKKDINERIRNLQEKILQATSVPEKLKVIRDHLNNVIALYEEQKKKS